MAERSFAEEVKSLRLGAGERFEGETILAVTKALLEAGVGYVGGCVPIRGGIALSMMRMNRILGIHPEDGVAIVQPGVITHELQKAVRAVGWEYPPDPASLKECSIGGNIATNAGGPRCLKYGVTRSYVLGLEVVLADGRVMNIGGRLHKQGHPIKVMHIAEVLNEGVKQA